MPTLSVPSETPLGTLSLSQCPVPPAEFVIKYRLRTRQVAEMSTDGFRTFSASVFTLESRKVARVAGMDPGVHLQV